MIIQKIYIPGYIIEKLNQAERKARYLRPGVSLPLPPLPYAPSYDDLTKDEDEQPYVNRSTVIIFDIAGEDIE